VLRALVPLVFTEAEPAPRGRSFCGVVRRLRAINHDAIEKRVTSGSVLCVNGNDGGLFVLNLEERGGGPCQWKREVPKNANITRDHDYQRHVRTDAPQLTIQLLDILFLSCHDYLCPTPPSSNF
jgi:hypothetical protein